MATLILTSLVAVLIVPLAFYLLSWRSRKEGGEAGLPPGPRGVPLLGYLPFLGHNIHRCFAELARVHGPIMGLRLGARLCVVLSSPAAAKEALKDYDAVFANHDVPAVALASMYANDLLWAPHAPRWRALRKVSVRELLSPSTIEGLSPLRRREVRRMAEEVRRRAGEPVKVRELAFTTALNVMTMMLWGGATMDEEGGGEKAATALGTVRVEFGEVIDAIVQLLTVPNVSDFFPAMAWLDLQGLARRMRRLWAWLDRIFDPLIDRRLRTAGFCSNGEAEGSGAANRSRDFLQVMLELFREGGDPQAPLTIEQVKALLVGDMRFRSTWAITVAVFEGLPAFQQTRVREMGFGAFLTIRPFWVDLPLIQAIRERWHAGARAFIMPWGHMIPTLEDVVRITGLRVDGTAVSGTTYPDYEVLATSLLDLPVTKAAEGRSISRSGLMRCFGITRKRSRVGESQEEFMAWIRERAAASFCQDAGDRVRCDRDLRRFLILLLSRLLFASKGDDIHCRFLDILQDLDSVGQYAWGAALLAHTFADLSAVAPTKETAVSGFAPFLQVWSYFYFPIGRAERTHPGVYPLARQWTPTHVRASLTFQISTVRRQLLDFPGFLVVWQPYEDADLEAQPWVTLGQGRFRRAVWVHCMNEIEPLRLRYVMRTLGLHQEVVQEAHPAHVGRQMRGTQLRSDWRVRCAAQHDDWVRGGTEVTSAVTDSVAYMEWFRQEYRILLDGVHHAADPRDRVIAELRAQLEAAQTRLAEVQKELEELRAVHAGVAAGTGTGGASSSRAAEEAGGSDQLASELTEAVERATQVEADYQARVADLIAALADERRALAEERRRAAERRAESAERRADFAAGQQGLIEEAGARLVEMEGKMEALTRERDELQQRLDSLPRAEPTTELIELRATLAVERQVQTREREESRAEIVRIREESRAEVARVREESRGEVARVREESRAEIERLREELTGQRIAAHVAEEKRRAAEERLARARQRAQEQGRGSMFSGSVAPSFSRAPSQASRLPPSDPGADTEEQQGESGQ